MRIGFGAHSISPEPGPGRQYNLATNDEDTFTVLGGGKAWQVAIEKNTFSSTPDDHEHGIAFACGRGEAIGYNGHNRLVGRRRQDNRYSMGPEYAVTEEARRRSRQSSA